MNRTKLKNYAPQARREFIQAVTQRAAVYGLTPKKIEPVVEKGDVVIIGGQPVPKAIAAKRKKLEERIKRDGFEQTMEALAYTWFNRFVAIRYMELHQYLEHGYQVLSHPDPAKTTPEILEQAEHVALPGVKKDKVVELKLAGDKEAELYRLLLVAQCNALHSAMPFLFEKIDDETELVLPENLLHSDSILRKLVSEIDEEDWQQVEIIGWLYQFYISEKKDQVIGKVVKSEDIPAATQLFTPNWIVKYLVQNSLGRQWLATYPQSALRQQMEYYIEPAEQTPEVQEQLKAITPESLNPEELTLLDPACGSGHILVEAYDLFKAIYQERGYRAKDIPALILQKNLFGLEIDDRAAQLAAFALMMKARADDRRIFDSDAKPNVLAFQETDAAFNSNDLPEELSPHRNVINEIAELFRNAKTFGSLIQVPTWIAAKIDELEHSLRRCLKQGDLISTVSARHILELLRQLRILVMTHDAVVANPPYMGGRNGMNPKLKEYVEATYREGSSDLFAVFIQAGLGFAKPCGHMAMVTMEAWMFLPSFKDLRPSLLSTSAMWSMWHLGPRAFDTISGEIVRTTAFALQKCAIHSVNGSYRRLVKGKSESAKLKLLDHSDTLYVFNADNFSRIPESRWAYWLTDAVLRCFDSGANLESAAPVRQGFQTGNNDYFMRYWHEVARPKIKLDASCKEEVFEGPYKWVPYNKGGEFRKWYGNNEYVVAFDKEHYDMLLVSGNCLPSRQRYFHESVTWSAMGGSFGARLSPQGFTFSAKGACAFPTTCSSLFVLAVLNSRVAEAMFEFLAPTLDFNVGSIRQLPLVDIPRAMGMSLEQLSGRLVEIARNDWDRHEESWDFLQTPLLSDADPRSLISTGYANIARTQQSVFDQAVECETGINTILLDANGLQSELTQAVSPEEITLCRLDKEEDIKRLLSYAVGCMMGRYSLDKPGLIYAHSGNQGFDPGQYKIFRADGDGIIPLLEADWGVRDDVVDRFVEFIGVAWPKEYLEENLRFVADSLRPSAGEQPRETIRRYLATAFYKHHLSTYKKRPIYWLFCSGKQRAFQCLVYLHRYHEGTLARMRTEYVIPLQGKLAARIEQLASDVLTASSTSHRKKLEKEREKLLKQQVELQAFDEKLRHYADQRIALDLDDGVKVNYAKFGELLAEVKAVTGGKEE